MTTMTLYRTTERPDREFWIYDDDGSLINFTGYTFVLKFGTPGSAAVFTKLTGITGAAGAGVEPSGTPNVTIMFTNAELDSIPAGLYHGQLRATSSNTDRIFEMPVRVKDVIT